MLTGVLVFVLILIALLAVPVTISFQISCKQGFLGDIKLHWLLGLVRARFPLFQSKSISAEDDRATQKTAHVERLSRKRQNAFSIVRQKVFRRRVIRFICDIWRAIKKRNVNLHVRIGLGDPADTGQLWSVVGPVSGMLANANNVSIEIEPEFLAATFELNSSGSIRIIPLQIFSLTIGLLLSPVVWRGIRQMRAAG